MPVHIHTNTHNMHIVAYSTVYPPVVLITVPGLNDGTGSSGSTYKNGVLKAMERTNPAIFIFENVTTVTERPKDKKGRRMESPIEAGEYSTVHTVQYIIMIYVHCFYNLWF